MKHLYLLAAILFTFIAKADSNWQVDYNYHADQFVHEVINLNNEVYVISAYTYVIPYLADTNPKVWLITKFDEDGNEILTQKFDQWDTSYAGYFIENQEIYIFWTTHGFAPNNSLVIRTFNTNLEETQSGSLNFGEYNWLSFFDFVPCLSDNCEGFFAFGSQFGVPQILNISWNFDLLWQNEYSNYSLQSNNLFAARPSINTNNDGDVVFSYNTNDSPSSPLSTILVSLNGADGNINWSKNVFYPQADEYFGSTINTVALFNNNELWLSGTIQPGCDEGCPRAALHKFDSNGNFIDNTTFAISEYTNFNRSFVYDPGVGIRFAMHGYSVNSFFENPQNYRHHIVELDQNFQIINSVSRPDLIIDYSSTLEKELLHLTRDQSGNYYFNNENEIFKSTIETETCANLTDVLASQNAIPPSVADVSISNQPITITQSYSLNPLNLIDTIINPEVLCLQGEVEPPILNDLNTWCKETFGNSPDIPESDGVNIEEIINDENYIYVIARETFNILNSAEVIVSKYDNYGNLLQLKRIQSDVNENFAGGAINENGDLTIAYAKIDYYNSNSHLRIFQFDDGLNLILEESKSFNEYDISFEKQLIFHQGYYYLFGLIDTNYNDGGILLNKFDDQFNVVWTKRSYDVKIGEQDIDFVAIDNALYINTGLNSLIAVDLDGNLLWTSEVIHPYLTDEDIHIYKIAKADENSIVLLGEKFDYYGCDEGCTDGVLTQFNIDGTLAQVKYFSANDYNFYLESTEICDGSFVVAGLSFSGLPIPGESEMNNIIHFDDDLNLVNAKSSEVSSDGYYSEMLLHFNNLNTSNGSFLVYNDESELTIHRQNILSEFTDNNQCDEWQDLAVNVNIQSDFTQQFVSYSLVDYSLFNSITLPYNEIDLPINNEFICAVNYDIEIEANIDFTSFQGTCNNITVFPLLNDAPQANQLEINWVENPSFANVIWQTGSDSIEIEAFGQGVFEYEVCDNACNCAIGQIEVSEMICPLPPEQLITDQIELAIGDTYQLNTDCVIENFTSNFGSIIENDITGTILFYTATTTTSDTLFVDTGIPGSCCPDFCASYQIIINSNSPDIVNAFDDFVQIQGDCNTATVFPLQNDELYNQEVTLTWEPIAGIDVQWDEISGAMTITSTIGGASLMYEICGDDNLCDEAFIEIDNLECFPFVFFEQTDTIFMEAGETVTPSYDCPFLDIVELPDNGDVVLTADGLTYTADLNNTSNQTLIIYTGFEDPCCGPQICEEVSITFIITPPNPDNEPPIAVDDFGDIDACTSTITIFPLANDFDPDGDELTIVDFYIPDNSNIVYDPITGAMDIETFGGLQTYYVICDTENQCDTADITILITDCPAPNEEVLIIELSVEQGDSLPIFIDFICDPMFQQIGEVGNYVVENGLQYFVASETFVGNGDLVLTNYWDALGCCVCQQIFINVTIQESMQMGDPPIANNDFADLNPGCIESVSFFPLDNDVDPDGGTLTLVDFDYPPPPGVEITYDNLTGEMTVTTQVDITFTYTVCDDENLCDEGIIEILTTDCPAPYVYNIEPLFTVEQGDSLLINVPLYCSANIEQVPSELGQYIVENGQLFFVASTTELGTELISAQFFGEDGCCACLQVDLWFNVIENTNDNLPPIANNDDAFYIGSCNSTSLSLLANDSDPEGGMLTVTDITEPSSGTLMYDAVNDILTLTNVFEFLEYTVCDDEGLCAMGTIAIGIADCFYPEYPDVILEPLEVFQGTELQITIETECDTQPTIIATEGTANYVNGIVTYQAPDNFVGNANISLVYLTEDGCCICQNFYSTVNVQTANTIVAVDDEYEVIADCPFVFNPLLNDFDPDGDDIAISYVSEPENGTLTFNPVTNDFEFVIDEFEEESFIYIICDGAICDTATVTFVNQDCLFPPEPCDPLIVQIEYNEALTFSYQDADLLGDLTTTNNGTLTVVGNNGFTYTPAEGFVGLDQIECTWLAADCCTFTGWPAFDFIVNAPADNTAPIANNDEFTIEGSCLSGSIFPLQNDEDPNGDDLTITNISNVTNGTATLNAANGEVYIEIEDVTLPLPIITYEVCDPFGLCDEGTITVIEISCPLPEPPIEVNATTTQNQNIELNFDASYLPTNMVTTSFDGSLTVINDSTIIYEPATDYTGTDSYISQEIFVSECCGTFPTGGISIMIEVETDTMVAIIPTEAIEFDVWPNPFVNEILISLNQNELLQLNLYNANGQLIKSVNSNNRLTDLSDLPPSVYIIEIETNEGIHYKKMIKQ